jgi:hypothetical protein
MCRVGAAVARVEEVPVRLVDRGALQRAEAHAGFRHPAPFLRNVLALVALQRAQEGGEVGAGLRRIGLPVELHALADQPAVLLQGGAVLVGGKQQVCRGQLVLLGQQADAPRQLQPGLRVSREQA